MASGCSHAAPTAADGVRPHPLASAAAHRRLRLDRIFLAGPEPLAPGHDHLWIIDYKTTTHGPAGLDEFLDQQRQTYRPTARNLRQRRAAPSHGGRPIRLALYYPCYPVSSGGFLKKPERND